MTYRAIILHDGGQSVTYKKTLSAICNVIKRDYGRKAIHRITIEPWGGEVIETENIYLHHWNI